MYEDTSVSVDSSTSTSKPHDLHGQVFGKGRINEAKAEQTRAEGERRALRPTRRMNRDEISTVLTELGDLAHVVVHAEAADKAKLYRELGLQLTYRPQKQLVEAQVVPGLDMCKRLVSEGGVEPTASR